MNRIFGKIGRIAGLKTRKRLAQNLIYAGMKIDVHEFIGLNMVVGSVLSLIIGYVTFLWQNNLIYTATVIGGTIFVYYVLINSIVSLRSDQRARYVEKVLPDALQLMAANLRSGVSTDESLVLSARPEFGFLADKIKEAGNKIATGTSFAKAFEQIPKDINSSILRQTTGLIIEGESSGGELSSILEDTSIDIRDTATLQKEVRSVIMVYSSFIFLAVCLIAPILYAVSTQLAGILSDLSKAISVQFLTEQSPTLQIAPTQISKDFLLLFSYVNLAVLAIFGSLMIALINRGNERYGLKYIPFLLGMSWVLFYIGRMIMTAFFGGIKVL